MLSSEYDIAIIGGGITGAAIARDASLRGLKVILCEKGDFAQGASSKSSKLIHGGLRYLEQFDFALVKEALEERSILVQTAPLHVKWLPFILPVYKDHKRPYWMIRLGLNLYDLFSHQTAPPFTAQTPQEILGRFPTLNPEGLQGGCLYYDAQMDDSRIVIENLRAAKKLGAIILNYTPAVPFLGPDGKVQGIEYSGKKVFAKQVIDATGAWSPELQQEVPLSPTKGVHLVIPKINAEFALTLEAPQDRRIFFLLPWNGSTLLGTTETPYRGSLDEITVDPEDIAYLLKAYQHYFPSGPKEILGSFAGVRPLVKDNHANAFKVSRRPSSHRSTNGLLTIVGGKYTIYRKMAQDVVDKLTAVPCVTATTPLCEPGESLRPYAEKLGLDPATTDHLIKRYGIAALKILERIEKNGSEKERFCHVHPFIKAELTYAVEEEFVATPDDWLMRRTKIAYHPHAGCECPSVINNYLTKRRNYDPSMPGCPISPPCQHR